MTTTDMESTISLKHNYFNLEGIQHVKHLYKVTADFNICVFCVRAVMVRTCA